MPSLVYNQQTDVQPATTPADAQGAHFTPAVGQAVEQLGQEGTRLAADYNRIQYMQKEADGVAQLQKNISEGYRNFTTSMDDWKGDPNVVQQNGTGLTQKFVGTYGDWQDQLIQQQPTPRLKRMAAEQSRTMGDHFFNQAHSWEVETNRAWRVSSIDDSINTDASTIQQNPSLYTQMLKDKQDAIDAMRDLHPADHVALSNKVRNVYSEAAFMGHTQAAPQDVHNLLTGQKPLQAGSIPQKIIAAANEKGVDPKAALAFAQFESAGMNPDAQNGQSTGLFQMQPTTAAFYGVAKEDLKDPDQNIKAGVGYMADNQKEFKYNFKRDPTLPEQYAMHLLGSGGGMALAKAPDNESFNDFVNRVYAKQGPKFIEQVQNANHLQNMTVGQVKATFAGWMNKASLQTAGLANAPPPGEVPRETNDLPDYMQQVTPAFRQSMLTHADNLLRKDDSEARALLHGRMQDQNAAAQRGESVPNPITVDDQVKAGIPYKEAVANQRGLDAWQQFGAQYAQVKTLPPAQQQALYDSSAPTPGQPGYATAAEAHDALGKAILHVDQQRRDDPIRYDQGDGLKTTTPLDLNKPDWFTTALNQRYTQAEQVARNSGTPYTPFSKQEAYEIGAKLTATDPKQALANLSMMRSSAPSQDYFNAAMGQVAKDHPLLAAAGQLAQSNPTAAFTVLQGDRMQHPPDGKKADLLLPSPEKFRERWNADMGAAYQGLSQTSEADKQAVIAYYVAKVPPSKNSDKIIDEDTWKEAVQAVAPSTPYNDRTTLVPAGSDPTRFADNVAARWDGALQAHGLDPKDYPASAFQLGSAGMDGVYVPYQGTTPLTANGRPVVIDLNAPQQPPPPPPVARPPMKGRKLTAQDINLDNQRFR